MLVKVLRVLRGHSMWEIEPRGVWCDEVTKQSAECGRLPEAPFHRLRLSGFCQGRMDEKTFRNEGPRVKEGENPL